MAWNVSIIPMTVPNKPSSGATAAKNLIQLTPQLKFPLTVKRTSSHSLSNDSTSLELLEMVSILLKISFPSFERIVFEYAYKV